MTPEAIADQSEKIDLSRMPYERYDMDDIKMMWRRYAHKIKEEGKTTFVSALTRRDPIFREEHLFVLEVDNQVQIDYIKPLMPDFIGYLRKHVKNYSINVIIELTKNPEADVQHLTGKDKFSKLARKNPNLHTLKNMFNLDIEY